MILYDSNGKRVKYELGELLGEGECSSIYKLSDSECIKIYSKNQIIDDEILTFINSLNLKNFYVLYKMLYSRNGKFRAHTMKLYEEKDIDILEQSVSYTLISLCNLYESVTRLADESISAVDLNEDNVLLTSDGVIVTDVDCYSRKPSMSKKSIKMKNVSQLRFLFKVLYYNALEQYHSDIDSSYVRQRISNLFGESGALNINRISTILDKYERPIDYVRKR